MGQFHRKKAGRQEGREESPGEGGMERGRKEEREKEIGVEGQQRKGKEAFLHPSEVRIQKSQDLILSEPLCLDSQSDQDSNKIPISPISCKNRPHRIARKKGVVGGP